MNTITRGEWLAATKKKKGYRERLAQHIANSRISAVVQRKEGEEIPRRVWLVLSGDVARVPNMKGHKVPGLNCVDPAALAKLKAMDVLFQVATQDQRFKFYDEALIAVIICGKRSQRFDCDNVLTTIRDWLEPATKKVGTKKAATGKQGVRGWGIGVIENDDQITGVAVHGEQLGLNNTETFVLLIPWKYASGEFVTFLRSLDALDMPSTRHVELLGEGKRKR